MKQADTTVSAFLYEMCRIVRESLKIWEKSKSCKASILLSLLKCEHFANTSIETLQRYIKSL